MSTLLGGRNSEYRESWMNSTAMVELKCLQTVCWIIEENRANTLSQNWRFRFSEGARAAPFPLASAVRAVKPHRPKQCTPFWAAQPDARQGMPLLGKTASELLLGIWFRISWLFGPADSKRCLLLFSGCCVRHPKSCIIDPLLLKQGLSGGQVLNWGTCFISIERSKVWINQDWPQFSLWCVGWAGTFPFRAPSSAG